MKKRDQRILERKESGDDDHAIGPLLERVRSLIQAARKKAATTINSLQVVTNF